MVLCGGLEFVAAGVVYHEYQKHKREKARLEDERDQALEQRYRRERERRRRHSSATEKPRPRPQKQDSDEYKYGYKPSQHTSSSGVYRPAATAAAIGGLYGATIGQNSPYGKHGSGGNGSMLALPAPPMRPSSAPIHEGPQFEFQNAGHPPSYMMAQNPSYNSGLGPMESRPYIPGQYATQPPPQQQQQQQQQYQQSPQQAYPIPPAGSDPRIQSPMMITQSPAPASGPGPYGYAQHDNKYPDPRRSSDSSLPLGIYEPSAYGTDAGEGRDRLHELSADRFHQQLPHVRFRLPNDRVVGTGSRSSVVETPPPAYSYRA